MDTDTDFVALSTEERRTIFAYINDPLLEENIKDIYECHGDPSGNMMYVAGLSHDSKYCVYVKDADHMTSPQIKINRYDLVQDYMEYLITLDQLLFSR